MNERARTQVILTSLAAVAVLAYLTAASAFVWRQLWSDSPDGEHVTARGNFIFETEYPQAVFDVPDSRVDGSSDRHVLAAACQAFDDWRRDRNVRYDVMLLDTPEYFRSAELLAGEFREEPAAFRVEELLVEGTKEADVLEEMKSGEVSPHTLEIAEKYLKARRAPPSANARARFVIYEVNDTRTERGIVRLECSRATSREL